jgi:hypothetical protein
MKLRAAALLLLPIVFAFSAHASPVADATPTPSLMDKTLEFFRLKHAPKPANLAQLRHGMEMKLDVSPSPFRLSVDREVKVTVTLSNETKKFIHLDFPTTQRIEILVKDSTGKVITTWSEDQSFTNDPATITINPGERIEYSESVATREMTAGQPYIIEVSFPNYPDLKIQRQVNPQK